MVKTPIKILGENVVKNCNLLPL